VLSCDGWAASVDKRPLSRRFAHSQGVTPITAPHRLSAAAEIRLARQIEAGVLAAAWLETDSLPGTDAAWPPLELSPGESGPPQIDELRALIRQGEQAKEALVMANLGLVRVIAADLARRSWVDQADLFQEGCLILDQTIRRYDYRRGRFGSFAACCLRSGLLNSAYPERREIASGDDLSRDSAIELSELEASDTRQTLDRGVNRLPVPERWVVRLRHGWGGDPPATWDQIAAWLNLSVPRVRRLERRGLDLLRQDWLAATT